MVSRLDEQRALDCTRELIQFLRNEGYEVILEKGTAQALGKEGVPFSELSGDIAVVVGGDGSVLLTVQRLKKQIPILGVNQGKVGFLTELEPEEAHAFFRQIRTEGFRVEKRMRISLNADGLYLGEALNEAVVVTSRPAKMLHFSIIIDGITAERFRADGTIIATPTGSTAYAMSGGGPIVDPRIEGILLVPLAPYLLSSRPHLISSDRSLRIMLESDKPARLVLDGQHTCELQNGTILEITKSTEPAQFVDVGKSFFVKVDKKLRRL